jgi:hypothetical protein
VFESPNARWAMLSGGVGLLQPFSELGEGAYLLRIGDEIDSAFAVSAWQLRAALTRTYAVAIARVEGCGRRAEPRRGTLSAFRRRHTS